MAPTPISVNGVLRLQLSVSDQDRHIDFFCNRTIADPLLISSFAGSTFDSDGGVVGQALWNLFKPFYPAGVLAPSWILFEYDEGTMVPLDSGSLTGVGTATDPLRLATQCTMTFRSADRVEVRLQLPETIHTPPQKGLFSESVGMFAAILASYTDVPDGTTVNTWITARSGSLITRGLFVSVDTNDKYRRARGL